MKRNRCKNCGIIYKGDICPNCSMEDSGKFNKSVRKRIIIRSSRRI